MIFLLFSLAKIKMPVNIWHWWGYRKTGILLPYSVSVCVNYYHFDVIWPYLSKRNKKIAYACWFRDTVSRKTHRDLCKMFMVTLSVKANPWRQPNCLSESGHPFYEDKEMYSGYIVKQRLSWEMLYIMIYLYFKSAQTHLTTYKFYMDRFSLDRYKITQKYQWLHYDGQSGTSREREITFLVEDFVGK